MNTLVQSIVLQLFPRREAAAFLARQPLKAILLFFGASLLFWTVLDSVFASVLSGTAFWALMGRKLAFSVVYRVLEVGMLWGLIWMFTRKNQVQGALKPWLTQHAVYLLLFDGLLGLFFGGFQLHAHLRQEDVFLVSSPGLNFSSALQLTKWLLIVPEVLLLISMGVQLCRGLSLKPIVAGLVLLGVFFLSNLAGLQLLNFPNDRNVLMMAPLHLLVLRCGWLNICH
ncbi:hypothetical protein [Deinococcus roseus]|nr:hypothetical protein [Deinococcus roseus]